MSRLRVYYSPCKESSMDSIKIILIAVIVLLSTGCATITRGKMDAMVIESTPANVTATLHTVGGDITCSTPCALELKRKDAFTVTFTKDGYETITTNVVPVQASAGSAGMAGNILFGGLIGAAVDAGSGAMKDLTPNPLVVKMIKIGESDVDVGTLSDSTDSNANSLDTSMGATKESNEPADIIVDLSNGEPAVQDSMTNELEAELMRIENLFEEELINAKEKSQMRNKALGLN